MGGRWTHFDEYFSKGVESTNEFFFLVTYQGISTNKPSQVYKKHIFLGGWGVENHLQKQLGSRNDDPR